MPNYPEPAKVAPHTWARGSSHERDGAIIYVGRRDIFIPTTDLPDVIARLQAISDATN
jgi:hypothetical protein